AVAPERWGKEEAGVPEEVQRLLAERTVPADTPARVCVHHTLIPMLKPSPQARVNVARVMFETDRLPAGWEQHLNRFDRIWVPSEFNRDTFVRSGVCPDKIAVLPGAIDPAPFAAAVEPWLLPEVDRQDAKHA